MTTHLFRATFLSKSCITTPPRFTQVFFCFFWTIYQFWCDDDISIPILWSFIDKYIYKNVLLFWYTLSMFYILLPTSSSLFLTPFNPPQLPIPVICPSWDCFLTGCPGSHLLPHHLMEPPSNQQTPLLRKKIFCKQYCYNSVFNISWNIMFFGHLASVLYNNKNRYNLA